MDNLRHSIKAIFSRVNPDRIFSNKKTGLFGDLSSRLPFLDFFEASYENFSARNGQEINNIFLKLEQDWFRCVYNQHKHYSVFNILNHFNKQVLVEIDSAPFVEFEHALRWRDVSFELGEDLFTTSFIALMDTRAGASRDFFAWRPVAFTTNIRLKRLLDEGMAENHFHLKGSAPVFDLSWLSLMNNVNNRANDFNNLKKFRHRLTKQQVLSFSSINPDIEILVYKAALIRYILYSYCNRIANNDDKNLNEEIKTMIGRLRSNSSADESYDLLIYLRELQFKINTLCYSYGFIFEGSSDGKVLDYAIPKHIHNYNKSGSFALCGERKLMYDCFRRIYAEDEYFHPLIELFYAYLLIKSHFRAELIQVNNRVGFSNFLSYQDRKELFIPENSIYNNYYIEMAVRDTLAFQNITHFENRIAPKDTKLKLYSAIDKVEQLIKTPVLEQNSISLFLNKLNKEVDKKNIVKNRFYNLHFIKVADTSEEELSWWINERHFELRRRVKKQAQAILELRQGAYDHAELIRGIDAASSETDARPEVFAQVFRYLKDHKISGKNNYLNDEINESKLWATFHAGEDFYDVVDGLRTISEAVHFLKLGAGDRIGHALALGIDIEDFYSFKSMKIVLPKEMLLDNVAWVLGQIRKFGLSANRAEVDRLERVYNNLFREIYLNSFEHDRRFDFFPHQVFYDAWKLRGDDPELYKWGPPYSGEIPSKSTPRLGVTYWERCATNHFYPRDSHIRKSNLVSFLYQQYHYNPKVRRSGKEIKQFIITHEYAQIVKEIQKKYQFFIADMNIGIECNPTSNYLIGTFKRYDKHPILNFYSLGLEVDPSIIKECPQLFVSINTDDQGIFGTSLENEYALMAIALEKCKDENGKKKYNAAMIYDWLDRIRRMGIEQSFAGKLSRDTKL